MVIKSYLKKQVFFVTLNMEHEMIFHLEVSIIFDAAKIMQSQNHAQYYYANLLSHEYKLNRKNTIQTVQIFALHCSYVLQSA